MNLKSQAHHVHLVDTLLEVASKRVSVGKLCINKHQRGKDHRGGKRKGMVVT